MIKPHMTSTRAQRLAYLGYTFVLSVVYDQLFWQHALGINYWIFFLAGSAGFIALAAAFRHLRSPRFLGLFGLAALVAVTPVCYTNALVLSLAPLFSFILSLAGALLATGKNAPGKPLQLAQIPLLKNIDRPITRIVQVAKDVFVWKKDLKTDTTRRILIGIAVSFPLVLLFGFLFYQADEIFAQWVRNLIDIEITIELIWRIVRTVLVTLLGAGFLYVAVNENDRGYKEKQVKAYDQLIVSIVLGVLNVLFLTFVFIQVKYLFGSADFVLENGLTFAEYARKGFFELVWIMVFAAIMILAIYRVFSYHKQAKWPAAFQVLLIVQVGVIAASALKRMNLYQDVFGYTVLRLYVEWFMYFVMLVLVGSIVAILTNWAFRKFFHTGLLVSLAALTLVLLVNVDAMIAKENVNRFLAGKDIDLEYLTRDLSVDAAPELLPLFQEERLASLSIAQRVLLGNEIDAVKEAVEERDHWFEWNRSVSRAEQELLGEIGSAAQKLQEANAQAQRFSQIEDALLYSGSYSSSGCNAHTILAGQTNDKNVRCIVRTQEGEDLVIALATPISLGWSQTPSPETAFLRMVRMNNPQEVLYEQRFEIPVYNAQPSSSYRSSTGRYEWEQRPHTKEYTLTKSGAIVEAQFDQLRHFVYDVEYRGGQVTLNKRELTDRAEVSTL